MHDILAVHFLKSFQDGGNHLLSFIWFKSFLLKAVVIFGFLSESSSLEMLRHEINGILRLKNLKESCEVFMAKAPHYFDLVHDALFPLLLVIICLL